MMSGINLDRSPSGVRSHAIFCCGCLCLVHKTCSDIKDPGYHDSGFMCVNYLKTARPFDGRTVKELKVDAVPDICYLGDMLSSGGGCELLLLLLLLMMMMQKPYSHRIDTHIRTFV